MAGDPSGDAVEELRVQTTMFDAAYGHSNGDVVGYATRSGANQRAVASQTERGHA